MQPPSPGPGRKAPCSPRGAWALAGTGQVKSGDSESFQLSWLKARKPLRLASAEFANEVPAAAAAALQAGSQI